MDKSWLKADKNSLKHTYSQARGYLPENLIDRLVLRNIILGYNSLFIKEWQKLDEIKEKEPQSIYLSLKKEFEQRWYIKHPEGTHIIDKLPSPYIKLLTGNIEEGKINIEIDLKGPKNKIMSELSSLISSWHDEFNADDPTFFLPINHCAKDHSPIHSKNDLLDETKNVRLPGNVKTDLGDYELYLEIYALKEDGNSWRQIVDHFKLNDIDTARNHYKSAKRIIKNGLPGLPPFPK